MTYTTDLPLPPGDDRPLPSPARPLDRPARLTRGSRFTNALAVLILLGMWQLLTAFSERIPGIGEVLSFVGTEFSGGSHGGAISGEFWSPLAVSLQRYGIGLAIGIPLGAVLGFMIGASRRFRALLNDTVLVLLVLPSVVWAFAASLWLGIGSTAPIVAVVLTAVPFLALNLRSGIADIDPRLSEMSQSFRVPTNRRLVYLLAGGAFHSVVTGVRLAFITSWNSLLIVEWFGASSGVGWRARYWYDALRFPGFVAWILVFVVFISLLDWLVLRRLERRSARWQRQPTLSFAEDIEE